MIPSDRTLPLTVDTRACANGETVELRLMMGEMQIGKSVWVNQFTTPLPSAMSRLFAAALDENQRKES